MSAASVPRPSKRILHNNAGESLFETTVFTISIDGAYGVQHG